MNCRECRWPLAYTGQIGRQHFLQCIGCGTEYAQDSEPEIPTSGVPGWLLEEPEAAGVAGQQLVAELHTNGKDGTD